MLHEVGIGWSQIIDGVNLTSFSLISEDGWKSGIDEFGAPMSIGQDY